MPSARDLGASSRPPLAGRAASPQSPADLGARARTVAITTIRTIFEIVGVTVYEQWRTQDDERTCPICGALDGMIWPADSGFTPPVHDHCRCQRIYHHIEYQRRAVDIPETTYVTRYF